MKILINSYMDLNKLSIKDLKYLQQELSKKKETQDKDEEEIFETTKIR